MWGDFFVNFDTANDMPDRRSPKHVARVCFARAGKGKSRHRYEHEQTRVTYASIPTSQGRGGGGER